MSDFRSGLCAIPHNILARIWHCHVKDDPDPYTQKELEEVQRETYKALNTILEPKDVRQLTIWPEDDQPIRE